MRKGLSPVVATVLLITIAVTVGMIIYWWSVGLETRPSGMPDDPYEIDVVVLDWTSGEFAVKNMDSRDMPAMTLYIAQNESATCAMSAITAGSSYNCTFGGGLSGQLTFMGKRIKPVTIIH